MRYPVPSPIYRMIPVDNLSTCFKRGALNAPNFAPNDNLPYKTIHIIEIQHK